MKLVLDFGNTLLKFAIFEDSRLLAVETLPSDARDDLVNFTDTFLKQHKVRQLQATIFSSVILHPEEFIRHLSGIAQFIELNHSTPLPVKLHYQTPQTLGKDRMAIASAAHHLYPKRNVLAINAGTCITYDFVDKQGVYHGGSISPGISMRFKALHTLTDKLPLLEGNAAVPLTGNSTKESIRSGVMNGVWTEVDGIIAKYREIYDNLTVILGGGDFKYFDKKLKNNIFAVPNLVLKGLNIILDFND